LFNVSCELVNHQLIQNYAVVTENGPILQVSVHPPKTALVVRLNLPAAENKQHKNVC